jgi:hypothetical protein
MTLLRHPHTSSSPLMGEVGRLTEAGRSGSSADGARQQDVTFPKSLIGGFAAAPVPSRMKSGTPSPSRGRMMFQPHEFLGQEIEL